RDGLARRNRDAKLLGGPDAKRRDRRAEGFEERWISRAATGDDELAPRDTAGRLALEAIRDRARSERYRRRERVVACTAVARHPPRELVRELPAEVLATGALRRTLREVLVAKGPSQRPLVRATECRAASALVEALAVTLSDEVAQDVCRTRIERRHAFGLGSRDEREVRDAAEVQKRHRCA